LVDADACTAIASPTLAHWLKTLASDATKHPKMLHHIRTLIIDCGCYLDCKHHVLVIQITNLFLDHLLDMTGLRKLELRITPVVNSDIYGGIIALACHSF